MDKVNWVKLWTWVIASVLCFLLWFWLIVTFGD